jgi:organic hydroperoxide reductase OsmC/OhrA
MRRGDIVRAALQFDIHLEWFAERGGGEIVVDGVRVPVSSQRARAGTEAGIGPEYLFVAAAVSSFAATMAEMLALAGLPQSALAITAEGQTACDFRAAKFTRITMLPTIHGADTSRRQAYEKAATDARNHCLIGYSIRGNVAYVIGEVSLIELTNDSAN